MTDAPNATSFVSEEVEASRLFFLDAGEEDDFAVVFGGFERCSKGYKISREDFPWYSLEFVSHGTGKVQLGDTEELLMPGSFYIYGPSFPHRIESSSDDRLHKYFVGFTGKGVVPFLKEHGLLPGFFSHCVKSEPIRRAFDTLIDRGARQSRLSAPLCAIMTRQLLLMCLDDATPPVRTDTPSFDSYTRAKEFVEKNFLRVATLQEIAAACEIDAPYLCRLFARFHGESPYHFLTRLRMEHASRLLLESGSPVKEVAALLGFKNAFHFSRVFKSYHRIPPSRFRKSMYPQ